MYSGWDSIEKQSNSVYCPMRTTWKLCPKNWLVLINMKIVLSNNESHEPYAQFFDLHVLSDITFNPKKVEMSEKYYCYNSWVFYIIFSVVFTFLILNICLLMNTYGLCSQSLAYASQLADHLANQVWNVVSTGSFSFVAGLSQCELSMEMTVIDCMHMVMYILQSTHTENYLNVT